MLAVTAGPSFSVSLEERQIEALAKITIPGRIFRAEPIRRAIDMYLSQPAIQEALRQYDEAAALVEVQEEPEAGQDFDAGRPGPFGLTERGKEMLKDVPPMPQTSVQSETLGDQQQGV